MPINYNKSPKLLPEATAKGEGSANKLPLPAIGKNDLSACHMLGVAPCTIMNWEHDSDKNNAKKIRQYLDELVEFE